MKKIQKWLLVVGRFIKKAFHAYINLYKGKRWYLKTMYAILSCIAFLFIYLGAVDINLFWLFGKSPGYKELENPVNKEASEIYSADGVLIGKYFKENRTPVKYEDVSTHFWNALISTEDERFYKHHGIDPIALFAAVKDAAVGRGGRGASTITQQLAKNMFRTRTNYSTGLLGRIPGVKILIMKSKEWIVAMKLEYKFSKEQILTMYANTVDFGSKAYGIKTAAKTYFNTTPKELKIEEAAVLVGMLKATTYYNPLVNPDNSKVRRNQVLENMVTHNHISREECNALKNKPIKLNYSVESNYDGQALYFREAVEESLKEWCEEEDYDLYSDGLKIYTTLDTRMQKYAEDAARKQMKQVQKKFKEHWGKTNPWQDENHKEIEGFIENIAKRQPYYEMLQDKFPNNPDSIEYYLNKPHKVKVFDYDKGTIEMEMSTMDSIRYMVSYMHCGFIAMEPHTGDVKAWVGDIDFKHWKYDKVTAMRQPGSTFKLFVYTEAMNQGMTPCDMRRDEYFSMTVYDSKKKTDVVWAPTNANGYFTGDSMSLKSAYARSVNSIAVRLGQQMGIKNIARTAKDMGINSELSETPSLPLGASDVNLMELANAYCVIADNGMHRKPRLVTRILNREGKEIYRTSSEGEQVIPYKSAFFMQELMKAGLREPGGTSQALWRFIQNGADTDFGGKTGTSNNHSDAWFMGITPKLVVGAWVGGEYRCIHFRTGALGQGSRTALPICGYFIESILKDKRFRKYRAKFDEPTDNDIESYMYQCASYYERKQDTINSDTLDVEAEKTLQLNEDGTMVSAPTQSITQPEKPVEEPIRLEDL